MYISLGRGKFYSNEGKEKNADYTIYEIVFEDGQRFKIKASFNDKHKIIQACEKEGIEIKENKEWQIKRG